MGDDFWIPALRDRRFDGLRIPAGAASGGILRTNNTLKVLFILYRYITSGETSLTRLKSCFVAFFPMRFSPEKEDLRGS
jgi:hypothetical protein